MVYYNGPEEDSWWISIFKWHVLTAERQVRRRERQWQIIWSRGTSLREPVGREATLTADKQLQQLPITSEQLIIARTSRSIAGVGGWNVHYHSFGRGGCQRKNHAVWTCEDERCRLLQGKILINTREFFCSFWQNSGRQKAKKGLGEKHTWLSPLTWVKHSVSLTQLCSTETMTEVSKTTLERYAALWAWWEDPSPCTEYKRWSYIN